MSLFKRRRRALILVLNYYVGGWIVLAGPPRTPHHALVLQPLKGAELETSTLFPTPSLSLLVSTFFFAFSIPPTDNSTKSRIMPMAVDEYTRGAPDWFRLFFCPVVGYPIVMDQVRSSASRIFNITSVEGRDDWDEVKINSIDVVLSPPLVGPT